MNVSPQDKPATLGLFEKRVTGDDCLLELARRRFLDAGMGTEMYAETPEQLEWLMGFRPSEELSAVVHLGRNANLIDDVTQRPILEFAERFAGRVCGLVVHDHPAMTDRTIDYVEAAWALEESLLKIEGSPMLYLEYAAGLEPDHFSGFFSSIRDLERISACIDVGHLGLRQTRALYAHRHGGEDIWRLKSHPGRLPLAMPEIENAMAGGLSAVLDLIGTIGALKKQPHFHLHDAHPLSVISPFGISDHLSFAAEIPLGFEYCGRRDTAPMFGLAGLKKIVARATQVLGAGNLSFTLEIHPTGERLPLGEVGSLFTHWTDKTNAEKMNHWLALLAQNHKLLRQAIEEALPTPTGKEPLQPVTEAAVSLEHEEAASEPAAIAPVLPPVEEAPLAPDEHDLPLAGAENAPKPPSEDTDSP